MAGGVVETGQQARRLLAQEGIVLLVLDGDHREGESYPPEYSVHCR